MRKRLLLFTLILLAVSCSHSSTESPKETPVAQAAIKHIPLVFEENQGQTNETVKFLTKAGNQTIFFTEDEVVYKLVKDLGEEEKGIIVRQSFVGANPSPEIKGLGQTPTKTSYFIGNKEEDWRTDIPTYSSIKYLEIYPGIDLRFDSKQGNLKYEYSVDPGVDYQTIKLQLVGNKDLRIENGNLVIDTEYGPFGFLSPISYQLVDGERIERESSYKLLSDHEYTFEVKDVNPNYKLVIDPFLEAGTFLASPTGTVQFGELTANSTGVYFTGSTSATDFPLQNELFTHNASSDTVVSKLSFDLTTLLYSTYIGGTGGDSAQAIDVDPSGNMYVCGVTGSTDFPVVNSFQSTKNGTSQDMFVAKISADGTSLDYASYIGSTISEQCFKIAAPAVDDLYIAGQGGPGFPTTGGVIETLGRQIVGRNDPILAKFDTSASGAASLEYSTFIPALGTGSVGLSAFDVDSLGNVVAAGRVSQFNIAASGGSYPCANCNGADIVIFKLNSTATAVDTALHFGASGSEGISALSLDANKDCTSEPTCAVFISGNTSSSNLPITPGAPVATKGTAFSDRMFLKFDLNQTGTSQLVYSTFLGDSSASSAYLPNIAVDSHGNAYFAGDLQSSNVTYVNNLPPGAVEGRQNVFIGRINSTGTAFLYSTHVSATVHEYNVWERSTVSEDSTFVDSNGSLYFGVRTQGLHYPTTPGSFQPTRTLNSFGPAIGKISLLFNIQDLRVIAGESSNGDVLLQWSPADGTSFADGGELPTDYIIEYGETSGFPGNASVFPDGVSTIPEARINGLENGTSYSFRVQPVNTFGSGSFSNTVSGTPIEKNCQILDTGGSDPVVTESFCSFGKKDFTNSTSTWQRSGKAVLPVSLKTPGAVTPTTYAVGNGPWRLQGGDLSGDGFADLVVANRSDATITVLFNQGDGTFDTGNPALTDTYAMAVGGSPEGVDFGDLDNDGDLDVFVSDDGNDLISVFENKGTGDVTDLFEPRVDLSLPSWCPTDVAIGDLNNDNFVDIAASKDCSDLFSVFLNNQAGGFNPVVDYPAQDSPISIAIGDLNNDGFQDIAMRERWEWWVTIHLNNGSGGFPSFTTTGNGNGGGYTIDMADLNQDGYLDIGHSTIEERAVGININNAGTFPENFYYGARNDTTSLDLADLNLDGYPDMIATMEGNEGLEIRLNDGDGTFDSTILGTNYPFTGEARGVKAIDLDNDGLLEIVTTDNFNDQILVFEILEFNSGSNQIQSLDLAFGNTYNSLEVSTDSFLNGQTFDLEVSNNGISFSTVTTSQASDLVNQPIALSGSELYFRMTLNGSTSASPVFNDVSFTLLGAVGPPPPPFPDDPRAVHGGGGGARGPISFAPAPPPEPEPEPEPEELILMPQPELHILNLTQPTRNNGLIIEFEVLNLSAGTLDVRGIPFVDIELIGLQLTSTEPITLGTTNYLPYIPTTIEIPTPDLRRLQSYDYSRSFWNFGRVRDSDTTSYNHMFNRALLEGVIPLNLTATSSEGEVSAEIEANMDTFPPHLYIDRAAGRSTEGFIMKISTEPLEATYEYDSLDRRVVEDEDRSAEETPVYDERDLPSHPARPTEEEEQGVSYEYDSNDRPTSIEREIPGSDQSIQTTYAYDSLGRVVRQVIDPGKLGPKVFILNKPDPPSDGWGVDVFQYIEEDKIFNNGSSGHMLIQRISFGGNPKEARKKKDALLNWTNKLFEFMQLDIPENSYVYVALPDNRFDISSLYSSVSLLDRRARNINFEPFRNP